MLKVKNLKAGIEDNQILKGINLEVNAGEVHAIMGPNGSGKSTLASVIAGKEEYEVVEGNIDFEGDDLLELSPEERAQKGVFLSFQYPVEIPGISVSNFIKTSISEQRKARRWGIFFKLATLIYLSILLFFFLIINGRNSFSFLANVILFDAYLIIYNKNKIILPMFLAFLAGFFCNVSSGTYAVMVINIVLCFTIIMFKRPFSRLFFQIFMKNKIRKKIEILIQNDQEHFYQQLCHPYLVIYKKI